MINAGQLRATAEVYSELAQLGEGCQRRSDLAVALRQPGATAVKRQRLEPGELLQALLKLRNAV